MRILLIDNDTSGLKLLKKYISHFYKDCEIIEFSDSKNAYDFIEYSEYPIDICYTTVMMPCVTGFQIANRLKKINKNTDVVFLSVSPEYALDAWKYSVVDYLLKPVTYEKIEHAVASCVPRFVAI
jgi:two-component SAPR family response regulator